MPNRAGMRTVTGSNQADNRWLAEFTDELDVLIAQREFDAAVAGIEKGTLNARYVHDIESSACDCFTHDRYTTDLNSDGDAFPDDNSSGEDGGDQEETG